MNTEKVSKAPATVAGKDQPLKLEFVDEIMALGTPVGTWGGSKDILLRIRELKPGAAGVEENYGDSSWTVRLFNRRSLKKA